MKIRIIIKKGETFMQNYIEKNMVLANATSGNNNMYSTFPCNYGTAKMGGP